MENTLSQSIIMRIKEFGETDLLVNFFSRDMGRLKGIAKGARKSRKRFPNCLDLFSLVNMEFRSSKRGELFFLESCRLIDGYPGLRTDYSKISLASYLVELTEVLFPPGVADAVMFELLKKSLHAIEGDRTNFLIRTFFESRAMALGGFEIALDRCCTCGRKYSGEGRAVFLAKRGGIACLKCEKESRHSPGLGPESVRLLKNMQRGALVNRGEIPDDIPLDGGSFDEINAVLKLHINYRLGRELKTSACLD
jgi:DNA repair protein RecO (recombination protein O)